MSSSDQRNSAEDIKAIVSYLKQALFSRNDSLVSFSRLSPLELLQLVNDIFASLDPKQQRDLRDEPSDVTTHRMIDFLITTLKYLPPSIAAASSDDSSSSSPAYSSEQLADFGSSFISAAPATIYPVMLYLLSHYESLKKRAYLAAFLTTPALPADMMGDPTLLSLLHSIQQQQSAFTALHKETDSIRASALHATALRKEVDQLEAEREQLKAKMKRLAARVEAEEQSSGGSSGQPGGFQAMLRFTNMLRLEQEEEAKIAQQREEQKARVDELKAQMKQRTKQYDDMCRYHGVSKDSNSRATATVNPLQLFSRLKAELQEEEEQVNRTLEVELADKEKTLKHLAKQSGWSAAEGVGGGFGRAEEVSADEVEDIERAHEDATKRIAALEEKKEALIGGNESQLGFLYDRLAAIHKKREKMEARMKEMEGEVDEVRSERDKIQGELDALSQSRDNNEKDGIPRNSRELKKYMETLTQKTAEYKKLKFALDVQYAEQSVLTHTFHTLQTRCSNQSELNAGLEKIKGLDGFSSNESRVAELAIRGQQLDEAKSENLEEISALVERIEAEIKAKKSVLAPSIKELRAVRGRYEALEAEYNGLKGQHEKIGLRYSSERLKLEGEVREKEDEKMAEERKKFQGEAEERVMKVREELLRDKGGRALAEYEDGIEKEMKALEKKERSLQREKRSMLDNGNRFVNQRNLFKNLEFLLLAREKALTKENAGGGEKDRLVF